MSENNELYWAIEGEYESGSEFVRTSIVLAPKTYYDENGHLPDSAFAGVSEVFDGGFMYPMYLFDYEGNENSLREYLKACPQYIENLDLLNFKVKFKYDDDQKMYIYKNQPCERVDEIIEGNVVETLGGRMSSFIVYETGYLKGKTFGGEVLLRIMK